MNLAQVARLLSGFILYFTLAQTIPLVVALLDRLEHCCFIRLDNLL